MFELFNSRYKEDPASLHNYGHRHYYNPHHNNQFRQYISQKTRDVTVVCYLGRDCAIRDYRNFSVSKIYKKDVPLSSFQSPVITAKDSKNASSQKEAKNKAEGDSSTTKKDTDDSTTIKLRGVPLVPYLIKKEEQETYKVLHQLEFNSFHTQAMQSAKEAGNN